jgi:amino acid transporter
MVAFSSYVSFAIKTGCLVLWPGIQRLTSTPNLIMDSEKKSARAPSAQSVDVDVASSNHIPVDPIYGLTKRGLSGRHVQLMALGGSIGTGLFVGIGGVLRTSGPLSLILGYAIYSVSFIYPCNLAVGEMATYLPIRGSIFEFAKRYIDEAFGFALGWTYFYTAAMLLCAELSAVATVVGFWDSETNPAAWVGLSLAVMIFANIFAVKWYGESEFIMAVSGSFIKSRSEHADLTASQRRSCSSLD